MADMTQLWVKVGDEVIKTFDDDQDGLREARALAEKRRGVILEATFEYSESALIEDYREQSGDD